MNKYECDVVIPFSEENRPFVNASIESILHQVEAKCLIHVILDGAGPIPAFSGESNVIFYKNSQKIGAFKSVNRIFNHLATPYMAIHDSDDIALPNRIAHSLERLNFEQADMFGGAIQQFVDYREPDPTIFDKEIKYNKILLSGNHSWPISPLGVVINGTRVIKKDFFKKMNGFSHYRMAADVEFTTRCIRAGVKLAFSERIMILRRLHSNSLSNNPNTGMQSQERLRIHTELYKRYEDWADYSLPFLPKTYGTLEEDLNA